MDQPLHPSTLLLLLIWLGVFVACLAVGLPLERQRRCERQSKARRYHEIQRYELLDRTYPSEVKR